MTDYFAGSTTHRYVWNQSIDSMLHSLFLSLNAEGCLLCLNQATWPD